MSLIYSSLYLITKYQQDYYSVIAPLAFIIFNEVKAFVKYNKNQPQITQKENEKTKNVQNDYKVHYGKWIMVISTIFIFNLLALIFPKNIFIIFLGLLAHAIIIKSPQSFNLKVEETIQKMHLQVYSEIMIGKIIDFYLDFCEKLNFYIIFYRLEEKEDRTEILNRIKDGVSRIQLQLQQDQVKNKSFIVAVKKNQNTSKKIKSYENVGVNCDILKGSQIGKEILKILEEKAFPKQKVSTLKIQQPTKDIQKNQGKTAIYTPRSESLQNKMKKIKSGINIPTSQKKMQPNQQDQETSHFMIKRSQTFDIEEFQFQDSPVSKKKQKIEISYGPVRTSKNTAKKMEEKQENTNKIIQSNETSLFRAGTNISEIEQKSIHPFKVNLSNLTNPLVISQDNQKNKILPQSLKSSQQSALLSSSKDISLTESNSKQNITEQFSQQSTIQNKLEVSINESQYSDMFSSQGEQQEPKLQIKVEAVLQHQPTTKGVKPRIDICNIALYDNKDLKFYSVYDHLIFSGRILRMQKKPDNFYEIICQQTKKIEEGRQVQNSNEKVQLIKKVKFRGQAKPFMKYLQKSPL